MDKPIKDATVEIPQLSLSIKTNVEGWFDIRQVKVGTWTLKVSALGYESTEETVAVKENQETRVTLRLKEINSEVYGYVTGHVYEFEDEPVVGEGNVPFPSGGRNILERVLQGSQNVNFQVDEMDTTLGFHLAVGGGANFDHHGRIHEPNKHIMMPGHFIIQIGQDYNLKIDYASDNLYHYIQVTVDGKQLLVYPRLKSLRFDKFYPAKDDFNSLLYTLGTHRHMYITKEGKQTIHVKDGVCTMLPFEGYPSSSTLRMLNFDISRRAQPNYYHNYFYHCKFKLDGRNPLENRFRLADDEHGESLSIFKDKIKCWRRWRLEGGHNWETHGEKTWNIGTTWHDLLLECREERFIFWIDDVEVLDVTDPGLLGEFSLLMNGSVGWEGKGWDQLADEWINTVNQKP